MNPPNHIRHLVHVHRHSSLQHRRIYGMYSDFQFIIDTSPTTSHFRPRIRFSALFPALHILKDAFPRREKPLLQPPLQPKTQIKILSNGLHRNPLYLQTDGVMHPSQDPFSRARIPYLECSPPRHVKSSTLELAKDWESINTHKYLLFGS